MRPSDVPLPMSFLFPSFSLRCPLPPSYAPSCALPLLHLISLPPMPSDSPFLCPSFAPSFFPPMRHLCPYSFDPSLWESNLVFLAAGSWPIPQSYFIPKPPRPARGLEFGSNTLCQIEIISPQSLQPEKPGPKSQSHHGDK